MGLPSVSGSAIPDPKLSHWDTKRDPVIGDPEYGQPQRSARFAFASGFPPEKKEYETERQRGGKDRRHVQRQIT